MSPAPSTVLHAAVHTTPLEPLLREARELASTPEMGAVVTFEGVVRNHDAGESVHQLHYTAHPTATDVIAQLAQHTAQAHPGTRLWVAHRVGDLGIGDLAFLVVVAAAHRKPAFDACVELVDTVKAQLPIWKEQTLQDGRSHWVGTENAGS